MRRRARLALSLLSEMQLLLELLLSLKLNLSFGSAAELVLVLLLLPYSDRCKEWLKVFEQVLVCDPQFPVEEEEELLLHEVDFTVGEAKVLEAGHTCVASPVLVLWGGVVEVLGCQDKSSQEDAVNCASHTLGNLWQL